MGLEDETEEEETPMMRSGGGGHMHASKNDQEDLYFEEPHGEIFTRSNKDDSYFEF